MPDNHTELAKQSYCIVKKTSPMLEEVRYYDQELFSLSECRQVVLNDTGTLAKSLAENEILRSISGIAETKTTSIINELGDIRRFQSTNQISAFIGIDLRHYESGNFLAKQHITKRGNRSIARGARLLLNEYEEIARRMEEFLLSKQVC